MLPTKQLRRRVFRPKSARSGMYELLLIVFTAIHLFPVYIIVTQSLKTAPETLFNPINLPKTLYLENITRVWELMDFRRVFLNSLGLTLASVNGISLVSAMCAFVLTRVRTRFATAEGITPKEYVSQRALQQTHRSNE